MTLPSLGSSSLQSFFRQSKLTDWLLCILGSLLSFRMYWQIGYELTRTQSRELLLNFSGLFLIYGIVVTRRWDKRWIKRWLGIGVAFRLLFLLSVPVLSDDYFRFIWDGRLAAAGYNPYLYLPSQVIHSAVAGEAHLDKLLFEGLNSPHYFTVYPPLNQLMFLLSAWIGGNEVQLSVILLRVFILLAEGGVIWLMFHPTKPTALPLKKANNRQWGLLYALNPLVIAELTGNLHFEAVTLFFVLLAVRWLERPLKADKYGVGSAIALGLGAAVKLVPLLFLPLFMKRLGFVKGIRYSLISGAVLGILFIPFFRWELVLNFAESLDLYFQKFEFNASFYYLFREAGYWLTGYNPIQVLGPLLSLATLTSLVWIAFQRRSFLEKMLYSLTVYFLLATTVHPWYITTLVGLGALTRRWYPVVWSALLPLTYVAYSSVPYHENLRIAALEYILVLGCLCYEVFFKGLDWEAS
ncbi:MAG: hypothetical protein U0X91_11060 [Spirosomataceae bacterium]